MSLNGITPEDRILLSSASLQKKIRANQRYHKYQRVLRKIRLRIFDYEDDGKLEKAHRIIGKIKELSAPFDRLRQSRIADRRVNPQVYK